MSASHLRDSREKRKDCFSDQIKRGFVDHLPIFVILGVYVFSCTLLKVFAKVNVFEQLSFYYQFYLDFLSLFLFLFLALKTLLYLRGGFAGLSLLKDEFLPEYLSLRGLGRFFTIWAILPVFVFTYSSFKHTIPQITPFHWDVSLMQIDQTLHLGYHPWEILQKVLGVPQITRVLNVCYNLWHLLLIFSLFWMAWSRRRQLRMQFFVSLALCWIILGSLLAMFFSSAGPCYFSEVTKESNPFLPLFSYLHSIPDLSAVEVQGLLWKSYAQGHFLPLGGISAMPSMHVSVAVLIALMGWRVHRLLGFALSLFAALILIGSVHLGWHYAIDGYFSILVTVLIWKITGKLLPLSGEKRVITT